MSHFKIATLDGKRYNIVWNGLYATHLMNEMRDHPETHTEDFINVQNRLAHAKMVFDQERNKVAFDERTDNSNSVYIIPILVGRGYVIPKTCHLASRQVLDKEKRKAGIRGLDLVRDFWTPDGIDVFYDMQDMGYIADAEVIMQKIAKRILSRK